ncbi:Anthranilate synthase component 2 [uncultured archaeon]|nr:Anthranilate synthase component 2 [uncultured archaeon]
MKKQTTLFIDNIDSFVYNLVQYVGVQKGNPLVIENTQPYKAVEELLATHDVTHIVISPGPKAPQDAGLSNEVIKKLGPEIPTLGVCLGHQCIGYVYGGKIRRAHTLKHGKTSLIDHDQKGVLAGIPTPLTATRYHSLVVDQKNLPKCLKVTATSRDDNEIMGLSHKDYPIYGVQFHPESILTPQGMRIIQNFLAIKK